MPFTLNLKNILFLILLQSASFLMGQPVNQTGFENFADESAYGETSLRAEGFNVHRTEGFNQNRAFTDEAFAHTGNKSLRVFYPKGAFGPTMSGVQAQMKVKGHNQYYVSYWLRFSDDFSFGDADDGGKLPGLGGGDNCSGCVKCNGSNGFSARLMWNRNGGAFLYLYDMNKKDPCGDAYPLKTVRGTDFYFQRGKWHHVIERVKINTGTNHDGEVEVWLDGKPAVAVAGLRFVTNGGKVDNFFFSTFLSGSSADLAPKNDSYIWFDDLIITTNYADIFAPLSVITVPANDSLEIGPQPIMANSFIYIQSTKTQDLKSAELLDTSNKIVCKSDLNANSQFYIPKTSKGIYYLRINNGLDVTIRKIYIE